MQRNSAIVAVRRLARRVSRKLRGITNKMASNHNGYQVAVGVGRCTFYTNYRSAGGHFK